MTTKRRISSPRPETVDEFIATAAPDRRYLLQRLRAIVRNAAPDAEEGMRWGRPVYVYVGLLCYLDKARHHVTLGFFHGAKLRAPVGMLEGSGSRLRHVKIRSPADIHAPKLTRLVQRAVRFNER